MCVMEQASAKGDSVAMQKAVDVLKEFEEKEKVWVLLCGSAFVVARSRERGSDLGERLGRK